MRHFDRRTLSDLLVGRYMQGCCTAFAVAVHRRTGWPMVVLWAYGGGLSHSGCLAPDGRYVDARGFLDREDFAHGFGGDGVPCPATPEQALKAHPQSEALISKAAFHADMLLDLPGSCSEREALEDFARDLAAFCASRGMALRGPGPGVSAHFVAYPADGDEDGFDVEPMPTEGVMLTRRLRGG